jgi:hypothetical protein
MNATNKNSEDYLKSVLKKETGFSAPENYFSEFENNFSTFLSEEKLSKKLPFKTPNAYFKNLEAVILSKNTTRENKLISISNTNKKWYKQRVFNFVWYAAAASIVLFISINSFIFNTDKALTFDTLSDNDIEYWLEENSLNTNDIAAILEDATLEESEFYFADIKDENIEEYIISINNISLLNEIN